MRVVALVVNRLDQARIREALRSLATVSFCQYVRELAPLLSDEPNCVVLVEPLDARGESVATELRRLRTRFPALAVVAYADWSRETASHIMALARAGVSQAVVRGHEDLRPRLMAALAREERLTLADLVMARMPAELSRPLRSLLRRFLAHPEAPPAVQRAAEELGVNRRTLVFRLRNARLPSPRIVASWCRLIIAARELDDVNCSVERAAVDSSFGSATAFRNMLKRQTGLTPAQLRERGGFDYLCGRFVEFLQQGRDEPTAARRDPAPSAIERSLRPALRPLGLVPMIVPLPRSMRRTVRPAAGPPD